MFAKTARFYDACYAFKDYSAEAKRIRELIPAEKKTLLDVACGTGKHAAELAKDFEVEGLDLDPDLLTIARERCPQVAFHEGDMTDFDLGKTFDVVTCLFSSIGYAETPAKLERALESMARHLNPGGILLLEPWLYVGQYRPGHLHMLTVDEPDLKIARMSIAEQKDNLSILGFEYLIATPEGVFRETETHILGLYAQEEYEQALRKAGFTVTYDEVGLMNRGLFIAQTVN